MCKLLVIGNVNPKELLVLKAVLKSINFVSSKQEITYVPPGIHPKAVAEKWNSLSNPAVLFHNIKEHMWKEYVAGMDTINPDVSVSCTKIAVATNYSVSPVQGLHVVDSTDQIGVLLKQKESFVY